jgi:MFS family permease
MTVSALRSHRPRLLTSPWWTLVAVSLGGMMVALDGTALTIAGPDIGRSVHASFTELQWMANAYLVVLAIALFPGGRFADRFGRRAAFTIGVVSFGLVSVLVATATTSAELIVLRSVQGLCGALLQPAALALLRAAFDRKRLDTAIGVWGGASAAAIAAGPVVAGLIVAHFGWPAVFLVNAPVAAITVVLVVACVRESKATGAPQRPVNLVRAPGVAIGTVLTGLSYFSLFGLLLLLTLYLQNLRGLDPVSTGNWLLPITAVIVLSAPLGGLLTSKWGPRWPAVGGLTLVCAGMLGFLRLGAHTAQSALLPAAIVLGIGTGVALIAATQIIVTNAPADMSALAAALQQVATQVGGALGIVVLGEVMSWRVGRILADPAAVAVAAQGRGPDAFAFVPGLHAAVLAAAAVIAVGALLALRVRTSAAPVAEDTGPPAGPSETDGERGYQQ